MSISRRTTAACLVATCALEGDFPGAEEIRLRRLVHIEAFGRGLPELAAATRVWRDFSEGPEAVYREGFQTIRNGWIKA